MTQFTLNNKNLFEFKTIINTISPLIETIPLVINSEELSSRSMDNSHGLMVDLVIKKEHFDVFESEEEVAILINSHILKLVLNRANKDDTGSFELDTTKNKLKITFVGITKREFVLPLITDIKQDKLPVPDMHLFCSFTIIPNLIKEIISDIGLFSESINIQLIDGKTLIFEGNEGDYGSKVVIELKKENESIISYDIEEENIITSYGIDYLRNIGKLDSITDAVTLEFGSQKPLRTTFQINDEITVIFLLGPYEEPEEV